MAETPKAKRVATLSDDAVAYIDKQLLKYPPDQRQSAIKSALMCVQDENGGWLTEPLIDAVADYIGMPRIAAYEVASFYTMFDLNPVGRHKINVCTNVSCMLRGSADVVKHLEERLGVTCGSTTKDGKFTLREVECLAACSNAPMMQIDTSYYEDLTPEKIDGIIDNYESSASSQKKRER